MTDKYLKLPASGPTFEETFITTSSGAGDAGKGVATNSAGVLDQTLMPAGVGSEARTYTASETITGPALVALWLDSGTLKVRYADASAATASKRAWAFVLSTISSGASGTVYFGGIISGLSSLTKAATYFLSGTTPGAPTATAPTTSGHCVQEVGVAISDTELSFWPHTPIIRA